MDILDLAVKALGNNLGDKASHTEAARGVLSKLVGKGDSLDLAGLVDNLKGKGLGSIADSWLGDGDNKEITAEQVKDVLGEEQVAEAAEALGTDKNELLDSLKKVFPQMVDKSSKGGSLMDSIGGIAARFF